MTLTHKHIERDGVQYWGVHDGTRATYIELVTYIDRLTGVYTCQIVPEGVEAEHDDCPWLGRCTTDSYGTKATDEVRQQYARLGDSDEAVYALLADLHAANGEVA